MPFNRPSLQTIIDRILSDFQTRITGASTLLRRSVLKVMGTVYGGAVHLLYGYLDFQTKQMFATTAIEDGLDTLGSELGVVRKVAIATTGFAVATGTNGTNIPAGSELQNADSEKYTTDALVTIAAGVVTMALTASVPGEEGNEDPSVELTFVNTIASIDSVATIDSDGLTGGVDEESDNNYRGRILLHRRLPPHGGIESDYVQWSLEVEGVTRAWAISLYQGIGTVGVTFVLDDQDTTIFPTAAQLTIVRDYLIEHEDPATGITVGVPVTAEPGLFVFAATSLSTDFTIELYPNTVAVQTAVQTEIETLLLRDGGPGNTVYLSRISEAISSALGESRHRLIAPVLDVTASQTQVHELGTITWQDFS